MIKMNDLLLTDEECKDLLETVTSVMESKVLRHLDAVKLIDVLLEACQREKADKLEKILVDRFKVQ